MAASFNKSNTSQGPILDRLLLGWMRGFELPKKVFGP